MNSAASRSTVPSLLKWTVLTASSLIFFVACVCGGEDSPHVLSATNAFPQMRSNEVAKANDYKDMASGIAPPSHFPLPNVSGWAGHPRPPYVNFYNMNDHYPDYLLCKYDVDVKNYNRSNEPKWFKAALEQARRSGQTKFPPIKWIAVLIFNVAEHKDASTFEQSFKVGAIFKAGDVFDSSSDLSELIARATMDRHPFKYDLQQPTPGEQQRWVIVERFAASLALGSQYAQQTDNWRWDQARADALEYKINHSSNYQEANIASSEYADMIYQRNMHQPQPRSVPLPNFDAGALGFNFYTIDDRFPEYLICSYDVSDEHYNQTNEAKWFETALLQIRGKGPKKFPPVNWVAVAIHNVAEHTNAGTFEQSIKVGAIFRFSEVIDPQNGLGGLIAKAQMDRHPFKYDSQGEPQQRWLIVESHVATNHVAGASLPPGNH